MHIIVGLDESASAQAALGWALRMAARCGATVEAARSWAYGSVPMQQLLPPEEMDQVLAWQDQSVVESVEFVKGLARAHTSCTRESSSSD